MKLSFVIYGFARAAGRPRSTALLPKGGKATQDRAREILDFYADRPIPDHDREILRDALALQARAHTYLPTPDKDWRNTILTYLIAAQVRQDPLWDGPIILEATFWFPVPKSYPKRIHDAVARGERIPRIGREDTEQLVKPIKDACRGLVWRDDVLVYDEHVLKLYGSPPRVEVSLELVEGDDGRKLSQLREPSGDKSQGAPARRGLGRALSAVLAMGDVVVCRAAPGRRPPGHHAV